MEELEYTHAVDDEPIPGYRLLHPLGQGGFGEVWKCEAPGGLLKAVKFVHGGHHLLDDNAPADEELRAVERVKTIRHPFILTMERVEIVDGELVIVMELADKSLADVLQAVRAEGKPGLERSALLNYLREAAEVLDVMNMRHGLQHLDIKPRNLFLVSNHVKVGDFGLVSSLSTAMGEPALGAITPLYASPEVFQGSLSAHSDQYSLAVVYQELLTSTLPFRGRNARQLMMEHLHGQPDLSPLPEGDRPAMLRALAKNPIDRFQSCTEFLNALNAGQAEVVTSTTVYLSDPEVFSRSQHDTRSGRAIKTLSAPVVRPSTLSGAGTRQVELLSRTPLSEVWRGLGSDGTARIVKVLFSCVGPDDPQAARLRKLNHPTLISPEITQHTPARMVLTAQPGHSLRDLFNRYTSEGSQGIPREELISFLRVVAQHLQVLEKAFGLNHLGLNPQTIQLEQGQVLLSEFGLLQLAWKQLLPGMAQINGRYSAPEIAQGKYSAAADQFSLAMIYHELLTGALPARKVDGFVLDRLAVGERLLLGRALHPDPERRWESPLALFNALETLTPTEIPVVSAPLTRKLVPAQTRMTPLLTQVETPSGNLPSAEVMQTRFGTTLPASVITRRIEEFRTQWSAHVVSSDNEEILYQMPTPRSLWQRWTGKQPAIDIRLRIAEVPDPSPVTNQSRSEVRMTLRPRDCNRDQCQDLLKVLGPMLIESMRAHLEVKQNGRRQERIAWHHPLKIASILEDGQLGSQIECQGKDISMNGIGFYLPGQLPASQVLLYLPPTPQTPASTIPARIVRVQGCGKGWYEVGAILLPPDQLPPEEPDPPESSAA
ncbi:MAG: protein kinase [Gemmataceae bacterium]